MSNVPKVVLTGGPCAGKTSILSYVHEKLSDYGRDVYLLPEAATFLIHQGMALKRAVREKRWDDARYYQLEIMRLQSENEKRAMRFAEHESRPAVIVCDRGIPDSLAYLNLADYGEDMYRELLKELGNPDPYSVCAQYAAVIKLTTAADGAEAFYTTANNTARDETPEEARHLDRLIERAYLLNAHFRVIDNSTDFEGKKLRALQAICHAIGIPVPCEIERKYLVQTVPCFPHFTVPYSFVDIEQSYIVSPDLGEEVRIRRRSKDQSSLYYLTRKRRLAPGKSVEIEEMISWQRYFELLALRDPTRGVVKKRRYCFLYKNQYFELDIFGNFPKSLCLLEIELTEEQQEVNLPPFVSVYGEVTDDPAYSNYALALQIR
jgi:CYTH domain-containing protein/predicted ATPase